MESSSRLKPLKRKGGCGFSCHFMPQLRDSYMHVTCNDRPNDWNTHLAMACIMEVWADVKPEKHSYANAPVPQKPDQAICSRNARQNGHKQLAFCPSSAHKHIP